MLFGLEYWNGHEKCYATSFPYHTLNYVYVLVIRQVALWHFYMCTVPAACKMPTFLGQPHRVLQEPVPMSAFWNSQINQHQTFIYKRTSWAPIGTLEYKICYTVPNIVYNLCQYC